MSKAGTQSLWQRMFRGTVMFLAAVLVATACAPAAAPPAAAPTAAPAAAPARTPAPAPAAASAPTPVQPSPAPSRPVVAPPTPTPAPRPAEDISRRYGGVLNFAWWQPLRHYDFYEIPGSNGLQSSTPNNGLLKQDMFNLGAVKPDLAINWEMTPDGLTVTFHLRKGVKWHDGVPFTAQDAAFSLNRFRNPPPGFTFPFSSYLDPVENITAPDDATVVIKLKHPYLGLFPVLAAEPLRIMPRHIIQRDGHRRNSMVGTGAFKFKEELPSVLVRLERNPDYFEKGLPYLDGVVIYTIPEPSTAQAALEAGKVQIVAPDIVNLKLVPKMQSDPRFKAIVDGRSQGLALFMQPKGPFEDIRVRKAIHLALDRQASDKVNSDGLGKIGGLIPSASKYARPESYWLSKPGWRPKNTPGGQQDLAEAKKLMAEAGHPNGFTVPMFERSGSYWAIAGPYVQADLSARLGIKLNIQIGNAEDWVQKFNSPGPKAGDYIVHAGGSTAAVDSAEQFLDAILAIDWGGKYPRVGVQQPRFQEYIKKIRFSVDPAEQLRLVRELEDYLLTDEKQMWVLPLGDRVAVYFLSAKVQGWGRPWAYNKYNFTDVWLEK